jgi:hypothetical protein
MPDPGGRHLHIGGWSIDNHWLWRGIQIFRLSHHHNLIDLLSVDASQILRQIVSIEVELALVRAIHLGAEAHDTSVVAIVKGGLEALSECYSIIQ